MGDDRIRQYVKAARALASGAFEVALPIGEGHASDEVAELGRALDAMARNLQRRFDELTRLHELTERINAGLMMEDVLDHVYESFHTVIPFDRIGFALIEDEGRRARAVWARSHMPDLAIREGYSADLERSSLREVLETARPRIIDDLEVYLAEHPDSESTRLIVAEGIRSSLTCPLIAIGHPVGFIFFSSSQPGAYDAGHVDVFMRIAGQLSLIIEKGRLYQALVETSQELERANRKLLRLAALDGLTGIPNRRAFDDRLDMEWRRAQRDGQPLSVVLLDIDHFKRFNDANGHLAGDDCLRAVASALNDRLRRAHDFVARFGGEEFGIILANTGPWGAARVGEMLRSGVERLELVHPDSPVSSFVTASVGVGCEYPTAQVSIDDLLEAADRALYEAKTAGRNRTETAYDESLDKTAEG